MDTQGKAMKSVNSKFTISKYSNSSTKSVGVTTRSMSKKLKGSSQMSPLAEDHHKQDRRKLKVIPYLLQAIYSEDRQLEDANGLSTTKFQQFDGKGNPKQHVAHFVETCNNAGTYGDHLVKQFVRSLKGNAFDCTRRTVSMVELTNSRQWKEEPVIDYINRWRNLSLNCKDRLSEVSTIKMCIQGMATCPGASQKQRKTRSEERGKPFSKAPNKESMAVNVAPFKLKSTAKDNGAPRSNVPYERPQRKLTLKEMQAREYPFLDSNVPRIFDDLLEANLIDLPEMKRPEEAERKDPKILQIPSR
ncbi:UNVERIFIED_CONTAM: hypothetical protein Sangu_1162100 [Sesamum angustifolium]|uniref:Retrotransposon gag protein n=1 Tax=Sesamum angustifolium TaxID=2727405 RepID=A0AAW2P2R1_9LAMI